MLPRGGRDESFSYSYSLKKPTWTTQRILQRLQCSVNLGQKLSSLPTLGGHGPPRNLQGHWTTKL